MPTIAMIQNIAIRVYPNDHPPAHFHLITPEFHAKIAVDDLAVLETSTYQRNLRPALDWAAATLEALWSAWRRYHD